MPDTQESLLSQFMTGQKEHAAASSGFASTFPA